MSSPQEHILATHWSARMEIMITLARIAVAMEAFPPNPDALAVRRWNHGIARELWILISAIGLESSAGMVVNSASTVRPIQRCQPIVQLLEATTWKHRRLGFDIAKLDRNSYIASVKSFGGEAVVQGEEWGFAKWWEWPSVPGDSSAPFPGWWRDPSPDVGAPIPVFESDRADIEASAGKAYGAIGGVIFEKECQLQDIERRIGEINIAMTEAWNGDE